jgi:hypothetical protein
MVLIVDGKKVPVQNDVKVVYEDVLCVTSDDEEYTARLHVTLNCEGAIFDLFDEEGVAILRTAGMTIVDMEEACH